MRAAPTASANGTSYAYDFYQDLKCSRCGVTGLYWVLTDRAALHRKCLSSAFFDPYRSDSHA